MHSDSHIKPKSTWHLRVPALLIVAVLAVSMLACAPRASDDLAAAEPAGDVLHITVSIRPQRYFVERIGGDHVSVNVMVAPGASPHTYEPRPEQMRALSQADAYMRIGVGFEDAWMERIVAANTEMMIVDTAEGIERMAGVPHHHHDEDADHHEHEADHHDDDGDHHEDEADHHEHEADHHDDDADHHEHEADYHDEDADHHEHEADHHDEETDHHDHGHGVDPHIWLSPRLAQTQARTIFDALVALDPQREAVYAENLAALLEDMRALDREIAEKLEGVERREFIVFHPSWGYFARDYGLTQIPIEAGGLEPGPADLVRVINEAREHDIRVILAQPEFSTQAAEAISQEIGGRVVLISPLEEDWLENLRSVSDVFAEVLGE